MKSACKGVWSDNDLRRAFVSGAAWWEYQRSGATIWTSDRRKAEVEAEKRYPKVKALTV